MPLPMWRKPSNNNNYEPIYPDLFEVIITNDDIDFILEDVIQTNFVNGSLVISIQYEFHNRDESMEYIKNTLDKIN